MTFPRALTPTREEITEIELHAFRDASKDGVCAIVHAVVSQPSSFSKGLVTARARLSKQGLTIPRLELVAAPIATSLITINVKNVLAGFPATVYLSSNSWPANRVKKIQAYPEITWHHVPTKENPTSLGS